MTTTVKVSTSPNPLDAFVFDGTNGIMTGMTADRPTGHTYHEIPDRPAPVAFFHVTKTRRGELSFVIGTEADKDEFTELLARQVIFSLIDTDRPTYDMDFIVGAAGAGVALDDESRDAFVITVPYLEM